MKLHLFMTRHIEVDLLYVHESQLETYKDEDIFTSKYVS